MFEQNIMKLKGVLAGKEYEKAGYLLTDIILKAYEQRVLKSRIWTYVAKVQFDKGVTTAQISLKTGFVTFGVDFFVKHINSIEDLLFLIIHERNHYILEHSIWRSDLCYLRSSLPVPLFSLIEDAFINGAAYRTIPSRISDHFYKHNSIAVILTSDSKGVRRVFKDKDIVKIHAEMWDVTKPFPDFGEFSLLLVHWLLQKKKDERQEHEKQGQEQAQENEIQPGPGDGDGKDQDNNDGGQKQGVTDSSQGINKTEDRPEDKTGQDEGNSTADTVEGGEDGFKSKIETEAEAVTPIVEGQHDTPVVLRDQKDVNPIVYTESGVSISGRKIEALTPKSEIDKAIATLTQKEREQFSVEQSLNITQLDAFISGFQCLRAGQDSLQGYTNTVPHRISKRDINSIQMGGMPVIWRTPSNGVDTHSKLYIDVSGSMDSYLGLIPYLFDRLMEHVDEIFEFSTVIVKVNPQDAYYYSTGGTSFNKVARHILDKYFKSVIVITDGRGNLSNGLIEKLYNHLEHFVYIRIGKSNQQNGTNWEKIANQIIHIDI